MSKRSDETVERIKEVGLSIGFDGKSWAKLATPLNEQGITTPRQGKPWSGTNLRQFCDRTGIDFVRHVGAEQHTVDVSQRATLQDTEDVLQANTAQDVETVTQPVTLQETSDVMQSSPGKDSADAMQDNTEQDTNESPLSPSLPSPSVSMSVPSPFTSVSQCDTEQDRETVSAQDGHVRHEPARVLHVDESVSEDIMEMLAWWKERKDSLSRLMESPPTVETRPTFKRGTVKDTATKTIRLSKELVKRVEREARAQKALTGGTFNGLVELLLWRFLGCPDDLVVPEGK